MTDLTITHPDQYWQDLLKMALNATYTKEPYLEVTMKLNQLQMSVMQAQQQNQRVEAMRTQQAEMAKRKPEIKKPIIDENGEVTNAE